jgi:hypothetical protein
LSDSFPSLAASANVSYSLANSFRSVQVNGSGISVTVIGNFDVVPTSGNVTFQNAGTWYNYLGSDSIVATGSNQSISLNPGDYKVYINKNLNDTSTHSGGNGGTSTTIPPIDTSSVNGIGIYPNPVVNSNAVVKYLLPASGDVDLSLYNIMGQEIFSFDFGNQASGMHLIELSNLPFNIYSLKNGIYILKLNSSQKTMHVTFSVLH